MPPHNVAALVHLVGFLTGAALYAMLFALVLRRHVGDDRLPSVTAHEQVSLEAASRAAAAAVRVPHPPLRFCIFRHSLSSEVALCYR